MYLGLIVFAVIVIGFLSYIKAMGSKGDVSKEWPYQERRFMSAPEQVVFHRLVQALPNHVILGQVQLSRLIGVKKGHNVATWLNKINRMSADYVVCSKDFKVVAVIELDDSSHQRAERVLADQKKDRALSSAGLKVFRWNVKSLPEVEMIKTALFLNEIKGDSIKIAQQ